MLMKFEPPDMTLSPFIDKEVIAASYDWSAPGSVSGTVSSKIIS